jgi:Outer membrane protein beta-barrel domain
MKKLFPLSVIFILALTLSTAAFAQQVIVIPACDGYNRCQRAPAPRCQPAQPRYAQPRYAQPSAPVRYAAPVTVPSAPSMITRTVRPRLRRWGISLFSVQTSDDEGDMSGGGFAVTYMLNRNWGIEGGMHFVSNMDDYGSGRDASRASLSGLWYPGGIKSSGISFYMKAGLAKQSIDSYGGPEAYPMNNSYNNDYYYEDDYYYSDNSSSIKGTSILLGAGIQWKMLDGFLSFSLETTMIGGVTDEDDDYNSSSPSVNLSFISSLHF